MHMQPDFDYVTWLNETKYVCNDIYADVVKAFLADLSKAILTDTACRVYPDLMTFGYFCRKANITQLQQVRGVNEMRFGWGQLLHIPPANIPMNLGFSWVFGLLAGNANLVRMPSRSWPQVELLIAKIQAQLEMPAYVVLKPMSQFFHTSRNSDCLQALVAKVDGLVVWGGDQTVSYFRQLAKKPDCVTLYFPNRVSSAVMDANHYLAQDIKVQMTLAQQFYNDTYWVDQNACSSPGIIHWVGSPVAIAKAKAIFWAKLAAFLQDKDYQLDPTTRITRTLDLMQDLATLQQPIGLKQYGDDVLVGDTLVTDSQLRFGRFIELEHPDLSAAFEALRRNEQTLTYFGFNREAFMAVIQTSRQKRIDRIVPFGQALNISVHWDGVDIIGRLSRRVEYA